MSPYVLYYAHKLDVQRLAQLAYEAAAAVAAVVVMSAEQAIVVGLDTSQPFAALKQQVNMRSDGSRVLGL